jgi:hypothetical protein
MNWSAQVFRYCERGADPGFWAEPLNALSNGAFIIAAIAAAVTLMRQPEPGRARLPQWLLVALVFVIGIGSFLFHSFATKWASLADVLPIGIFMLAYLAYALRVYLGLAWITTAVGIGIFVAAMHFAGEVECRPGLMGVTTAARGGCLNGTAAYVPAFLAMLGIGAAPAARRHSAARLLIAAAVVFLISMVFRTIDLEVCQMTMLAGHALGTHFLWHILNATTLYLLLLGAIRSPHKRHSTLAPRALGDC